MTQTLSVLLSIHILVGAAGVIASYTIVKYLFRRNIPVFSLKVASFVAFISYIIAWISGGYYYVIYYGGNVKPIIKSGAIPWAHSIIMEVKEHIFLFLPVLSFVVFLVVFLLGDKLQDKKDLRNALALVAIITLFIGVLVSFGGIAISGAAR